MFFSKGNIYEGKHTFITGGTSGIGHALAREVLMRKGSVTVVGTRDPSGPSEQLRTFISENNLPGRVLVQQADTRDIKQVQQAVSRAYSELGPIDFVWANAGVINPGIFVEQDLVQIEDVLMTNVLGVIYTVKCTLPDMVKRKQGDVTIVGSLAGFGAMHPATSAYNASKFAVRGFADVVRLELLGLPDVNIHLLTPGPVDTEMTQEAFSPGHEAFDTKPNYYKTLTNMLFKSAVTPEQQAKQALDDLQRGRYMLRFPRFMENLQVAMGHGVCEPPMYPWLVQIVLAPLLEFNNFVMNALLEFSLKAAQQDSWKSLFRSEVHSKLGKEAAERLAGKEE